MIDYKKAVGCVVRNYSCKNCPYQKNCAEKVKNKQNPPSLKLRRTGK